MELVTVTEGYDKEKVLTPFTSHGVVVPAGFIFDGASSPRLFWTIVPPFKGTKKAAVVHDWLCKNAKNRDERKEADILFRVMLEESGMNKVRSTLGYWGVRIGALLGVGVYY